jgi:hypothetical protein
LTFRHVTRAVAVAVLATSISLPLTHLVARAQDDTSDFLDSTDTADPTATNGFLSDPADVQSAIQGFVPTSPTAQPCPDGLYQLMFQGEPVVSDASGTPVCVTKDASGSAGVSAPGQAGESGGDSNNSGDVSPGQLGEGQPGT